VGGTPRHSVSVAGIVVRDDGRVLVIQRRDNGHWEPPGGVLELDETFDEGVRREVAEETGVQVEVEQLTGVYKNLSRGIVALVFRCRPAEGEAIPTDESRRSRGSRGTRFAGTWRPPTRSGCWMPWTGASPPGPTTASGWSNRRDRQKWWG
jgi:8-oxo-dGTP diphosphatase